MSKRELAKIINRSAAELAQVAAFSRGEDAGCLNEPSVGEADLSVVDLGKDGSKWKHEYIPLNAAAVALKMHRKPPVPGDAPKAAETAEERSARLRKLLAAAKAKAAARAPGKARAALGDNLQILGERTDFVNRAEAELDAMPTHVLEQLKAAGVKAAIHDGPLTNVSVMSAFKGAQPRGWPPGRTWDDVGGVYHTPSGTAIASRGDSAAISTIGHELGHGYDARVLTPEQRKAVYDKLRPIADGPGVLPYFKQPGDAGVQELFAEAFGAYTTRGADGILRSMAGFIPDPAQREALAQIMLDVVYPNSHQK